MVAILWSLVQPCTLVQPRPLTGSSSAPPHPNPPGNACSHIAAARAGHQAQDACDLLLARGADINAACKGGRAPLLAAIESNCPSMIKWLVGKGADPHRWVCMRVFVGRGRGVEGVLTSTRPGGWVGLAGLWGSWDRGLRGSWGAGWVRKWCVPG